MSGSEYHPIITTRKTPERTRSASIEIKRTANSQLGTGTFASVLKAIDKDLGREIAYKELHAKLIKNNKARDFFVYEGQIMAQLDHPNIVPVYEMGRCHSTDNLGRESIGRESLYLAMKRIRGRTLLEVIKEREPGALEENELFSLLQSFLKVCDAVGFAHSKGVIHRDLKPSNIMLGDYGEVYVLDWG
jgi:serine/threonine-protein kinase